jgi:predicted ATPase
VPETEAIYRVLGPAGQGGRVPRGERVRSHFVGRQTEFAALQAACVRVQQGQGQVVSLVGEPGIGKSRLLEEFRHAVAAHPLTYLASACQAYGHTTPYKPVLDLLRQLWRLPEAEDLAAAVAAVHEGLHTLGLTPDDWAPYLLHLMGLPDSGPGLRGLPPQLLRARTFASLHQVLLTSSRRQPLVLQIEDLHWIDTTSAAYLTALVERLANAPLLLLVSYRPGYQPPWLGTTVATQMGLAPLGPDDSQRLLQDVLRHRPLSTALQTQMLSKAAGNPLFLEELAQAVVERVPRLPRCPSQRRYRPCWQRAWTSYHRWRNVSYRPPRYWVQTSP